MYPHIPWELGNQYNKALSLLSTFFRVVIHNGVTFSTPLPPLFLQDSRRKQNSTPKRRHQLKTRGPSPKGSPFLNVSVTRWYLKTRYWEVWRSAVWQNFTNVSKRRAPYRFCSEICGSTFLVHVHKCPLDCTAFQPKGQYSVLNDRGSRFGNFHSNTRRHKKNRILHGRHRNNPKASYCPYLTWMAGTTDERRCVCEVVPYSYSAHDTGPPKSSAPYSYNARDTWALKSSAPYSYSAHDIRPPKSSAPYSYSAHDTRPPKSSAPYLQCALH